MLNCNVLSLLGQLVNMLNNKIFSIYNKIIEEAYEMVVKNVEVKDLTGRINYASIYAASSEEFTLLSDELEANGEVSDVQPTGNYFLLKEPFQTRFGEITVCRVRKPDAEHRERGYVDFEAILYKNFITKYLGRQYFSLIENVHGIEIIELRDPEYNVRAYFPSSF